MKRTIIIQLTREEALACAVALDREKKPYKWQRQALVKVDEARKRGGN